MKLALGTVQFGVKYGINNKTGIPADEEIQAIFNLAEQNGIDTYDTAVLYGSAEQVTGKYCAAGSKIVSKFPGVEENRELEKYFQDSLQNLGADNLYAYLAHDAETLINRPALWQTLQAFKEGGRLKKAGYSLYTPEQLQKLLDLGIIPDIVQLPYSLLDRKFEHALGQLRSLGAEVHIRSVFLQGLYFMTEAALPSRLSSFAPALKEIREQSNELGIDVNTLALNFVTANPYVDKVVIGVETVAQLQKNIDCLDWSPVADLPERIKQIKVPEPSLLNPANW